MPPSRCSTLVGCRSLTVLIVLGVDLGDFHVVIDSVARSHMISHHANEEILLAALKGSR